MIISKAMSYVLGLYFDLVSVDGMFLIVAKLLFCVMDLDDDIRTFGYLYYVMINRYNFCLDQFGDFLYISWNGS
jgi:hypothetical protein